MPCICRQLLFCGLKLRSAVQDARNDGLCGPALSILIQIPGLGQTLATSL